MKKNAEKCDMCKKIIKEDISLYRIKRKFLYKDYDGWWYFDGPVLICQNCIDKIRENLDKK